MAAVEVAPIQAEANGNHAEANGNSEHVDEPVEQVEQTEQAETEQPKEHRLYFVRIPRPTFDDSALKKLDLELGACFTKLKAINSKAQVKRVSSSSATAAGQATDRNRSAVCLAQG